MKNRLHELANDADMVMFHMDNLTRLASDMADGIYRSVDDEVAAQISSLMAAQLSLSQGLRKLVEEMGKQGGKS